MTFGGPSCNGSMTTVRSGSSWIVLGIGPAAGDRSASVALIRLAHGCQPGTCSQIDLIAAISGIARNSPGVPHTRSQNRHASMTVVAFRSMCRPMTSGTIR